MFCELRLIFDDTEGVGSRFHVLRSRSRFRRFRGRRVRFSCFARSDSFSTEPRVSDPVFMFCAPGLVFGGTEGIGSLFHVLRSQTRYRRNRGRWVPFFISCPPVLVFDSTEGVGSCFHVLRAGLVFGRAEGVGSSFHVLCTRTRFRRCRVRRVPFSRFALPDSFSAVPRSSGPVFMFCPPRLIFDGTEGVGSRFHVFLSRSRFRRYRGSRVHFSCFARPDFFSTIPRASGPVFMYYELRLIFDGTEGVGYRFLVLRSRSLFRRFRGRRVRFSCNARL
jgi:hypothetical protein